MTSLYRKLVFYYKPEEITRDTNVIFTFTPPTKDPLSEKQNRAAWKVVEIRKSEPQDGTFIVEYLADFGFSTAQVPGQTTNLETNRTWSTPRPLPGGSSSFQAINKTDTYQDIAVGTIAYRGEYIDLDPTFLFRVGSESAATAQFQPTLMMYSTMNYKQNSLMTAEVTTGLYWQQELDVLKETTYWNFTELPNGKYEVTPKE
ncbi:hypothetical protein L218DRAFT_1008896 [Marasmius fiardii PR-910]|nr:hypothetical protein L218DRAFT_1008896 [Marasmius fiardii PR-910]